MLKRTLLFSISIAAALFSSCSESKEETLESSLKYPKTKKVDHNDTYFGVKVPDPFRWLEDDKSEETAQWVQEQNLLTFGYLEKIPFRNKVKERLSKIWNYPKYSLPIKEGENYFFFKNDGLQNQSVLYIQKGLNSEPKIFLDPNTLSEDGTIALGTFQVSKSGKFFAYSLARSGSDWNEIKVKNVATGQDLADKIEWVKFSGIAWHKDGFFYSRYDKPKESELSAKNEYHKVFYHKIGDDQSKDVLIYEDKENPLRNFYAQTTEDERFLIISGSQGTSGNALFVKDLQKPSGKFITIVEDFKNDHTVVDNIGNKLLILTNLNAPNNRLVEVDLTKPASENWKDVIPEQKTLLESVSAAGGKLFARYLEDAYSKIYQLNKSGKLEKEIELPGIGTAGGFRGRNEDKELFYSFTSFTFPTNIYKYDIQSGESVLFRASEIDFNAEEYDTKQVFYTSKDGTKVPMFITHKKGIELNGKNPTMLYSYGGFDINMTPNFSIGRLVWLENGGVYAQPSIRGGGEYGQKWHEGGMLLNKQNVFDDFIAAAEYLIDEGYTSSEKLAISGGSNGGLLVGACMTQRPDLFKVALPAVGVLDMLRYHKFTIGWAWAVEYGSSDDSVHFHNLIRYSPLHNVKSGVQYPATLVTTADHDDRVVPAHSFKFIAELQDKHKGPNPVLIRISVKAGHGAGKPTSKIIEELADIYSFTWYNMEIAPQL